MDLIEIAFRVSHFRWPGVSRPSDCHHSYQEGDFECFSRTCSWLRMTWKQKCAPISLSRNSHMSSTFHIATLLHRVSSSMPFFKVGRRSACSEGITSVALHSTRFSDVVWAPVLHSCFLCWLWLRIFHLQFRRLDMNAFLQCWWGMCSNLHGPVLTTTSSLSDSSAALASACHLSSVTSPLESALSTRVKVSSIHAYSKSSTAPKWKIL